MKSFGDPRITIDEEIAAFDADPETAFTESTISELFSTYPDNQDVRHVLVKVCVINDLYRPRVRNIDLQPLSIHIKTIEELDTRLRRGTPDVVDAIWKSQGTSQQYFSFATKFCSWHNQEAYAMCDGNVWEALVTYRAKNEGFAFRDSEVNDYPGFLAIVRRFQKSYGLEDYSLKSIDKFLWQVGGRLLAEREKAKMESRKENKA